MLHLDAASSLRLCSERYGIVACTECAWPRDSDGFPLESPSHARAPQNSETLTTNDGRQTIHKASHGRAFMGKEGRHAQMIRKIDWGTDKWAHRIHWPIKGLSLGLGTMAVRSRLVALFSEARVRSSTSKTSLVKSSAKCYAVRILIAFKTIDAPLI